MRLVAQLPYNFVVFYFRPNQYWVSWNCCECFLHQNDLFWKSEDGTVLELNSPFHPF